MADKWRLSNTKKPNGTLDSVQEFLKSSELLKACMVSVPLTMDIKTAKNVAASLISPAIRSFEIWWDGDKKELSIVLVAEPEDLTSYIQTFTNMYPNANFVEIDHTIPEWFDRKQDYHIFDVETYHGHYCTVFDTERSHQIITQIANTIQLSKYAWIQFVFRRYDFTPFLQKHVTRLDKKFKDIGRKDYKSLTEAITSDWIGSKTDPHDHPEKGYDFDNNYRGLQKHSTLKMQGSHAMMSVRGLVFSDTDLDLNFDEIESLPVENIRSNHEHLTKNQYPYKAFYQPDLKKAKHIKIDGKNTTRQKINIFESRLLSDPRKFLSKSFDEYFNKHFLYGYRNRNPLPFLMLLPDEMALMVHLPDGRTPNLATTRKVMIPQQQSDKVGINVGFFKRYDASTKGKDSESLFGELVKSSDSNSSVISPEDFTRHLYAVGGTGTGKTSLIREIAKHLEMLNVTKQFQNAFIYLDPKGDDSFRFIQQCDRYSLENGFVHFLDPILTKFSINPLELPDYLPEERTEVVSRYVGYFMEIVKEWYQQSQIFVQMERIFRALLYYIYTENDAPTFLDIHDIILRIQEDGEEQLQKIFATLGKPEAEMKQALESIAGLKGESFTPLLNRVEQFATDPILKQIFCVRRGTVKFEELIAPGHYTIVRISALNMPHHVQPLAMQAFIIKLWFSIQERAARIPNENERTQVVLALDEFQIVKDLQVLPLILSQARSYHLGLMLAHQTTAQLNEKLLEEITGNCGTQLSGKISGRDAGRIANIWDPQFNKEIQQQLAAQEDYHWTIRSRAAPGEEQPPPAQFWLHYPPKLNLDDSQRDEFIAIQKEKYGYGIVDASMLKQKTVEKNRWLDNIIVEFLPEGEWKILLILNEFERLKHMGISERFGSIHRDIVNKIEESMVKKGLLVTVDADGNPRNSRSDYYSISENTRNKYLKFDSSEIGTAEDIPQVTKTVVNYYLKKGYFLAMASQTVRKGKDRSDLVAYDYKNNLAISVEIESQTEVMSHPAHVLYNMEKWPNLGFDECHVWSLSPKINEIKEKLQNKDIKEKVQVFVLKTKNKDRDN